MRKLDQVGFECTYMWLGLPRSWESRGKGKESALKVGGQVRVWTGAGRAHWDRVSIRDQGLCLLRAVRVHHINWAVLGTESGGESRTQGTRSYFRDVGMAGDRLKRLDQGS